MAKQKESVSEALLSEARAVIGGPRRVSYGNARESFERIAVYWGAYLGHEVTAHDVAMLMVLFKASREANKHARDNLVDIAGYAALAEECAGDE